MSEKLPTPEEVVERVRWDDDRDSATLFLKKYAEQVALAQRDADGSFIRAAFALVRACLDADACEELTDMVDGDAVWDVRQAFKDCEDCEGHGTVDRLPHEDEFIEEENRCPKCDARGFIPALATPLVTEVKP